MEYILWWFKYYNFWLNLEHDLIKGGSTNYRFQTDLIKGMWALVGN
jgi:hypothetical protein